MDSTTYSVAGLPNYIANLVLGGAGETYVAGGPRVRTAGMTSFLTSTAVMPAFKLELDRLD